MYNMPTFGCSILRKASERVVFNVRTHRVDDIMSYAADYGRYRGLSSNRKCGIIILIMFMYIFKSLCKYLKG